MDGQMKLPCHRPLNLLYLIRNFLGTLNPLNTFLNKTCRETWYFIFCKNTARVEKKFGIDQNQPHESKFISEGVVEWAKACAVQAVISVCEVGHRTFS